MLKYRTEGNTFATLIESIIDKNTKQIVTECQDYLDNYSNGIKSPFSTNIDLLLQLLSDIE